MAFSARRGVRAGSASEQGQRQRNSRGRESLPALIAELKKLGTVSLIGSGEAVPGEQGRTLIINFDRRP